MFHLEQAVRSGGLCLEHGHSCSGTVRRAGVGVSRPWALPSPAQPPQPAFLCRENAVFSIAHLKQGRVWTLLTSSVSHHDTWHLLLNCAGVYFVGRVRPGVADPTVGAWRVVTLNAGWECRVRRRHEHPPARAACTWASMVPARPPTPPPDGTPPRAVHWPAVWRQEGAPLDRAALSFGLALIGWGGVMGDADPRRAAVRPRPAPEAAPACGSFFGAAQPHRPVARIRAAGPGLRGRRRERRADAVRGAVVAGAASAGLVPQPGHGRRARRARRQCLAGGAGRAGHRGEPTCPRLFIRCGVGVWGGPG